MKHTRNSLLIASLVALELSDQVTNLIFTPLGGSIVTHCQPAQRRNIVLTLRLLSNREATTSMPWRGKVGEKKLRIGIYQTKRFPPIQAHSADHPQPSSSSPEVRVSHCL